MESLFKRHDADRLYAGLLTIGFRQSRRLEPLAPS